MVAYADHDRHAAVNCSGSFAALASGTLYLCPVLTDVVADRTTIQAGS